MRLGLEVRPRPDLHENDRTGLAFGPIEALKARIRAFFERPNERVMGEETAAEALERFEAAIRRLLAETDGDNVAVVTHGTVLTLLAARYNPIGAYDFWNGLSLPSLVALERDSFILDGSPLGHP